MRQRRRVMGHTLSYVAKSAGCSESMVSKIETDNVNPSLTLLRRIASALDINVAMLFSGGASEGVVSRAGERPMIYTDRLQQGGQVTLERLAPHREGALLQANMHIIAVGGASDGQISHVGQEVGYLLEGVLDLTVGDRTYRLNTGDSFHFGSEIPHGYLNPGDTVARVLWVNTPATF